jgi:hypothetical protein
MKTPLKLIPVLHLWPEQLFLKPTKKAPEDCITGR